jgi:hypothetical protein
LVLDLGPIIEARDATEVRTDVSAREFSQLMVRIIGGVAAFSRQGSRSDVFKTVLQLLKQPND